MDGVIAAILAVVWGACVSAVVAAADKRCLRQPPKAPMTFKVHAFDTALRIPGTGWFHKKLRCDKESFLRIYALVHAAWGREPGPNCKNQVIKRVALTMLYLAQGGTMDQAATVMGISRPKTMRELTRPIDAFWRDWQRQERLRAEAEQQRLVATAQMQTSYVDHLRTLVHDQAAANG
ncbi:hypothetical protein PI124_g11297 [Phytophthora idaei]|nr:hypothetical protein PI125_g10767 [Phytophthora idaei]KAG3153475.1 hypothetical protein PI126_g10082 [Phytophthora idaei]KAG3243905.1 hypothetical protein PI124_g11297 [Phytophthora idaei]